MGKIIAEKVRGMNWKAKISIILIFTLVFSTFMYQGLYKPKQVQAAVAFGSIGTTANGTTSLSVPYPAGIAAGNLLVLAITNKYPTNGPSTPAGWTPVTNGQGSGGAGAAGADSGTVYSTVFVKVADGTETGNLAVTITGGNSAIGVMARYTKAAGTVWSYAATNGSDNSSGTAWSVTGAANPGITSGDLLIVASAANQNGNSTYSGETVTATGATIAAGTERVDAGTNQGDDSYIVVSNHAVTAGTASAAPVFTMTGTGNSAGASVILRIRELPAGSLQFTSATFSVNENVASVNLTVSRTGGSAGAVSVQCANAGTGTATGGGTDYTMTTPQTLNWADGDTANKNCTVTINNDSLDEANETVNALLQNVAGGATIGAQSTATLTITDDDPTPSLSINDVTQAEGNAGTSTFAFTVTLSAASGQTVTVNYATADGTATTADNDYVAIGSTLLTFNPGETTKPVNVTVNGDTTFESNQTFNVNLSGASNATISDSQGVGTINNDDAANAAPTLSVSQPDGTGDTVTVGASYNVTYSLADTDNVVTAAFYYDTNNTGLDGTAISGACATAAEGTGVTCSWNTTGMTPGSYYVYGITNDGVNPAVSAYSPGQITINAAPACTRNTPTVSLGADGTVTPGGNKVYTATVTNNDTAACSNSTFTLSIFSETGNTGSFTLPSGLAPTSTGSMAPGAVYSGSTLTVNAQAGATVAHTLTTTINVADATNHAAQTGSGAVTTTVAAYNNPLLHNSVTTESLKWSGAGGWGLTGTQYGMFVCETCHTKSTTNIKRVKGTITAPTGSFPGSAVNFQSTTTPNGFGDDSGNSPRASSTKICEVCHTYDGTGANGVQAHPYAVGVALSDHYAADGTDCTTCHKHNAGFKKMACDTCHGNPPIAATFGGPTGLSDPDRTGSTTAGKHETHATTLSFACGSCHYGYIMPENEGSNPQTIDIGFSMWTKDGTGTTYGAANEVRVLDAYRGTNGTAIVNDNTRNCSNLYCHGNFTGGLNASPTWTGTAACGTCHANTAATAGSLNNSHSRHAGSGAGGISVVCADCHGARASQDGHVNGKIAWSLNTGSSTFGTNAKYNSAASGEINNIAPSASYQTCSTLYCHSNVQDGTGTAGATSYGTPTWGAAGPLTCSTASCHGNPPATPTANNAHGTHTSGSYSFITCSACHNNGGDESANHANGTLNMTIAATYVGTYSQGDHTPGSGGYGNCTNIYCHGNFTGGLNASPAWGASFDCTTATCHNYTNATPPTKVNHPRHVGTAAGQLNLACTACHPARASLDGHVDSSVQWDLDRTNTKVGPGATYSGTETGATGAKAPSAAYANCGNVYCHSSVQSGDGTAAPLSYATPTWGAASVTCDSCHGQGTGVDNGAPSTGSHEVHVTGYSYACSVCHSGLGDETATHADRTINLAFEAATAGGSATYSRTNSIIPQSGTFGTCTTTFCHGDSSNTSGDTGTWGTNLSASDACTVCHGTKTTAADGAAAVINRAPGGSGTGVDTSGTIGTITRNVSADPEVGAHNAHLGGLTNISNAIACTECHAVPAVSVAGIKGHLDGTPANMTWGTLATTGGAPGGYDPATHTCSNVYCHNEAYFSTSNHTNAGTGLAPVWNNINYFGDNVPPLTSTECGRCHFYDASDCSACHNHVAAGNLSFADKTKHIDGLVQGAGDCVGCHVSAQTDGTAPARRAMSTELTNLAWGHKKTAAGVWTKYDCGVCHMEGDPVTGATTALHKDNLLQFRDPDTGVTIKGVTFAGTPGSYTSTAVDATAATFARNTGSNTLEAFAQAVQVNLCLKCHDAGGAASASARVTGGTATQPFGASAGTIVNVDAHFATTNSSYHPVKGKNNNSYADGTTMVAPWNGITKPDGTTATYGDLMTCWDCHDSSLAGRTIGGATASVTAHGAATTLRGTVWTSPSTLCTICHTSTIYSKSGGMHGTGSAFVTPSVGQMQPDTRNCQYCHASAYTKPARPTPAADVHGFNALTTGGNWPGSNYASRPYAFIRNTQMFLNHRPKQSPEKTNTTGACNLRNGATCSHNNMPTTANDATATYTPGGVY